MPALPGSGLALRLIARPLPYSNRPAPLRDPAADGGLFGPGSVTWRVMREPLLMLGAGRALLMQAAHPLVAQGAIDHSAFATDPYGRLERTVEWVTLVSFGTTAEARAVSERVLRVHARISGRLPAAHATPRLRAGREYSAANAALLRWVHASFVDSMLVTHDAVVGDLQEADRDRFVREWDAVARLMGVPPRLLWADAAALRDYVRRQIERGPCSPGAGSRLVARTVLHPPVRTRALRPGMDTVAFVAVGLLPRDLRAAYGLRWTPAHRAAHTAMFAWLRAAHPVLPRRLRVSPVHDRALARAQGRGPGWVSYGRDEAPGGDAWVRTRTAEENP